MRRISANTFIRFTINGLAQVPPPFLASELRRACNICGVIYTGLVYERHTMQVTNKGSLASASALEIICNSLWIEIDRLSQRLQDIALIDT